MNRKRLKIAAPWLVGVIAMFAIGWKIAGHPTGGQAEPSLSERTENTSPNRPQRKAKHESLPQKMMRSIRDAGSLEARTRAAVSLANSLPPSEFAAWSEGDLFTYRSGPELFTFRMIIYERWAAEDPDSLIAWTAKNNWGHAHRTVSDLANTRPEVLLNFYKQNPNQRAELGSLSLIAANRPDLALSRLIEISESNTDRNLARQASTLIKNLAKTSLAALEANLNSFEPAMRKVAEKAISGQHLAKSFSDGIERLSDNPDGWDIFRQNLRESDELKDTLVDHLDEVSDLWRTKIAQNSYLFIGRENARKWLESDLIEKGFSEKQENDIKQNALSQMAAKDPEFAFQQIGKFEIEDQIKRRMISSAISAQTFDLERAEAIVAMLSSDEDKAMFRAQLEIFQLQIEIKAEPDSTAWFEKLGDIDPSTPNSSNLVWSVRNLEQESLEQLTGMFQGLPPAQKLNIATIVASGISNYSDANSEFFGEAVRYYAENPPPSEGETNRNINETPAFAASSYAVNLAKKDPVAATQWIATLPKGDTRLWTQKNVAKDWAQYDPKAVNQWIKTLPADERSEVIKYLDK